MTPERVMFWAIAGFFLPTAIEFVVARRRVRPVYRGNGAINCLGLGVISPIVGMFTKLLSVGIYAQRVHHRFAPAVLVVS